MTDKLPLRPPCYMQEGIIYGSLTASIHASYQARERAIAERLKRAMTLDLDGLENEIEFLIKELEGEK